MKLGCHRLGCGLGGGATGCCLLKSIGGSWGAAFVVELEDQLSIGGALEFLAMNFGLGAADRFICGIATC